MSLWWLLVVACVVTPFVLEVMSTSEEDVKDRLSAEANGRSLKRPPVNEEERAAAKAIREKCHAANALIAKRFGKNEITAARYRVGIEEVRLGFVSNLNKQDALRATVAHLNRLTIEEELKKLVPGSDDDMIEVLEKRLEILSSVHEKILSLQAANEQAINALDKSIISLSALPSGSAVRHADLETVVGELELLVSGAHRLALDGVGESTSGNVRKRSRPRSDTGLITPGAT